MLSSSVSYTHLDVYKRQEQSRAEQSVTSCFFCVTKLYKVRGDPLPSGYG